jgi:hypothetical protein
MECHILSYFVRKKNIVKCVSNHNPIGIMNMVILSPNKSVLQNSPVQTPLLLPHRTGG